MNSICKVLFMATSLVIIRIKHLTCQGMDEVGYDLYFRFHLIYCTCSLASGRNMIDRFIVTDASNHWHKQQVFVSELERCKRSFKASSLQTRTREGSLLLIHPIIGTNSRFLRANLSVAKVHLRHPPCKRGRENDLR